MRKAGRAAGTGVSFRSIMDHAPHHEEETLGKAYDGRLMRRLLRYLRPYAPQVGVAVVMLAAASGLQIVGPFLTQQALDVAIPRADRNLLGMLGLAYVGILALNLVFEYAQGLLTTWLGQRVMRDLRTEIFGHLQRLDLGYHDRTPVGRLMTRVTSDVETLNELFSSGVVTVFGDVFTLIFIVGAMLALDWQLALVSFAVMPVLGWVVFLFRSRIRSAYREIRVRLARINAFLQERITGIQVVQLFGREAADLEEFDRINADYLTAHLRSITYYALFFPVMQLFTAVALALVLWYGGGQIIQGSLTVGVVAATLQLSQRFFRPIQDLSEKYNLLQGAMASSERIFRLLDTRPRIQDPPPEERISLPPETRGEIEFRDVWFAYGETEEGEPDWVLKGVSFRVAPGEKIAIVGHTGAGKSTIINLLMRFYDPQKGEIRVDGAPIRRLAVDDLRDRIGLVLQDVFLFSQSVERNIRLGNESIDDEAVRRAAREVGAESLIQRLPGGFAQPLGERGQSLSVGERQLISFARALAFDPEILILDEATSSVDSEIEARIEEATNRVMEGRTSLVIAHRLSTVKHCDRILVMHHGALVEEGPHSDLVAAGGLYARLHELQFTRV